VTPTSAGAARSLPPDATATARHVGPPAAPAAPVARERLLALDVFRGATVAGMLLVNNPGSWGAIYAPLEHAPWHGWTPTDLIFPFFLFIVGITTHLSLDARRGRGASDRELVGKILSRGAAIFALGLLLSAFPLFNWRPIAGDPDPSFLDRVVDQFANLRVMGVLQRIALAYVCGALLTLRTSLRQQIAIAAALLLGYWALMTLVPVPDSGVRGAELLSSKDGNLAAWVDRLVIGPRHLWVGAGNRWDPEGLLSTLPAIGTVMLGVFAGRWIGAPRPLLIRIRGLLAAGALGIALGLLWGELFPINKSLWTSSYVVFTAGMAAVGIALCLWVIDERRVTWWTKPFVVYGVNPMIAFLLSGMVARLIYSILKVSSGGETMSLQRWMYETFYASWLAPKNASLLFAISFVVLFYFLLAALHRRRIYFRV
jgi:predicted acyltransferase